MTVSILIGDVRDRLREMPADSIDCVVTSPPYWGLRDYGVVGQIGLEPTLGEHLSVMVDVFEEVRRVLKPTGTLWLNYGDCYATSPNGRSAADTKAAGTDDRTFRDKPFSTVGPIYDPAGGAKGGGNRGVNRGGAKGISDVRICAGGNLKPKDLCMVPNRLAIALQEAGAVDVAAMRAIDRLRSRLLLAYEGWDDVPAPVQREIDYLETEYLAAKGAGWWVRSEIIWAKPNPMPESINDRPATSHEKIFLLSKAPRYFYDADAVRQGRTSDEDANTFRGGAYTGGETDNATVGKRKVRGNKQIATAESAAKAGGSSGRRMAGFNERWDAKEKAQRDSFKRVSKDTDGAHGQKPQSRPDREDVAYPRGEGRNLRNYEPAPVQVWPIATRPFSDAHFATFPPELAERCLLAGCPKGGTVLDPFGGAGTTALVADRMGLDCTIIELNPEYAEIARKRITSEQGMFANVTVANDQTASEAA